MYRVLGNLTGNIKSRCVPNKEEGKAVAEKMSDFYIDKIDKIRKQIDIHNTQERTPELHIVEDKVLPKEHHFTTFTQITYRDLKEIMQNTKDKTCKLDPIPTTIVKKSFHLLHPILLQIINFSLQNNVFPDLLKNALVTPVIKSESKDPEDFQNYRPISNLAFLSKLLEIVMYLQLYHHIESNRLFPKYQSSYRTNHSCETAMVKVTEDLQRMLSQKNYVVLVLLDSSAAFDTVDHNLLLTRLEQNFYIKNNALCLIKSYLENRTFSVVINDCISSPKPLAYGVPQGSVLGPLFYLLYTKEMERIIEGYGFKTHVYADDCQIYFSFDPGGKNDAEDKLMECMRNIKFWMDQSFLKLNPQKTSIKVFTPKSLQNIATNPFCLVDDSTYIKPSPKVKVLGVTLGEKLNFHDFAAKKIQVCNLHLRNMRSIRNALPQHVKVILVTNLIISNLDYCNALLMCAPNYIVLSLQRTLNRAVRFIFNLKRTDHITQYLYKLHILPVKYRIKFKVSLIAYKIVRKTAPEYLQENFKMFRPTTTINLRPAKCRDRLMFEESVDEYLPKSCYSAIISEWNDLPYAIRAITTIDGFKRQLKTFYFRQAYTDFI